MNAPRLLALCLLACWIGAAVPALEAQAAGAREAGSLLRAADLQQDVAILRRAYETLHPGLYRYNTPAQMEQAFRALEQEFARDRSLAEAYVAFSLFAARVKCGHTYPNFFNQTKETQVALFRAPRVPFHFRWLDGRMIVTRSFANDARLVPGTEVLAIDGTPARTILARMMTVARADGSNDDKRAASMEVQGLSRYEAFDVYFPLLFPSTKPQLSVKVRTPGERRARSLTLQPLTYEQRLASMDSRAANKDDDAPAFDLRILDDGIASLRMPTWALYDTKWDWKAFVQESFETVVRSGVSDLVLDVRGNEGGLDVGDELAAHLITRDIPRPAIHRRVRYRTVPADLKPFLDTWDPSFFDWGSSAIDLSTDARSARHPPGDSYRLRRDADDDPASVLTPAAPTFTGRTWVLVGAENSSATFEFAQLVQQNRIATLVGQPTGGNQRGINGGAFFFLRLPRSGIELDLPIIGQFAEGDPPDAGLRPDVLVVPTAKDIAEGRDAEMEEVRARIRLIRAQSPKR